MGRIILALAVWYKYIDIKVVIIISSVIMVVIKHRRKGGIISSIIGVSCAGMSLIAMVTTILSVAGLGAEGGC